jgi:hypothetical protein
MIKRKKVDGAKLIKMVENGKTKNEIMKEFNLKNDSELKSHYINALVEASKKLNSKKRVDVIKVTENTKKFNITFNKIVEIDMNYYEDNKDEYSSFLEFIVVTECTDWLNEDEWKIEEVN